jgi:acyl carrier protein
MNDRVSEIRAWLIQAVASRTRLSTEEISPDEPIHRYGIDSLERVNLAYELERWLGRSIDAADLIEHTTIEALAKHLAAAPGGAER